MIAKNHFTILEQYAKQQGADFGDSKPELKCRSLPNDEGVHRKRKSDLAVNEVNVNPLSPVNASFSACPTPNIEILDSNATKGLSNVKVVSVKAPNLNIGSTRSGSKLRLARIEDVDTSGMKVIDRTVMQLRKLKASLLAEVPQMVQIQADDSISNQAYRREAFLQRLSFASKQGGDRRVIDGEIRSHSESKRQVISQRQRKKKQFRTLPVTAAKDSTK